MIDKSIKNELKQNINYINILNLQLLSLFLSEVVYCIV